MRDRIAEMYWRLKQIGMLRCHVTPFDPAGLAFSRAADLVAAVFHGHPLDEGGSGLPIDDRPVPPMPVWTPDDGWTDIDPTGGSDG